MASKTLIRPITINFCDTSFERSASAHTACLSKIQVSGHVSSIEKGFETVDISRKYRYFAKRPVSIISTYSTWLKIKMADSSVFLNEEEIAREGKIKPFYPLFRHFQKQPEKKSNTKKRLWR